MLPATFNQTRYRGSARLDPGPPSSPTLPTCVILNADSSMDCTPYSDTIKGRMLLKFLPPWCKGWKEERGVGRGVGVGWGGADFEPIP